MWLEQPAGEELVVEALLIEITRKLQAGLDWVAQTFCNPSEDLHRISLAASTFWWAVAGCWNMSAGGSSTSPRSVLQVVQNRTTQNRCKSSGGGSWSNNNSGNAADNHTGWRKLEELVFVLQS